MAFRAKSLRLPGDVDLTTPQGLQMLQDRLRRLAVDDQRVAAGAHGLLIGTKPQRLAQFAAANYPAGQLYFETDRGLTYRSDGRIWRYYTGTLRGLAAAIAGMTSSLGTADAGLLYYTTDFRHLSRWSGTAWEWGDGELGGGRFEFSTVVRTDPGWHALDGSTVSAQTGPDGTLTGTVLPNAAAAQVFLSSGTAYTGTILNPVVALTAGAVNVAIPPANFRAIWYFRQ